jgi:carbon storage regulator
MLVLTRKKGQSLHIGDHISIVIVDVTGDTVRLGIEAPPEVSIYRSEIYRAIQEENRAAVAPRNVVARLMNEAPKK